MPPNLRDRLPVLVLVGLIAFTTVYDWWCGLPGLMAVPMKITLACKSLLAGMGNGESVATLLTSVSVVFLHADAGHVIWNLILFWIFGVAVFEVVKGRWFLALFVLTAIGGTVGHILFDPWSTVPMVGASGVVFGLMGNYLGLAVQRPREKVEIWPVARPVSPAEIGAAGAVGVMLDFMAVTGPSLSNIAHGAHMGGFATGLVLALIRRP